MLEVRTKHGANISHVSDGACWAFRRRTTTHGLTVWDEEERVIILKNSSIGYCCRTVSNVEVRSCTGCTCFSLVLVLIFSFHLVFNCVCLSVCLSLGLYCVLPVLVCIANKLHHKIYDEACIDIWRISYHLMIGNTPNVDARLFR